MKVIVAYMSNTGNTKKVAEAICDEIQEEKTIANIDDVASIEGYDLAFLGFPVKQMGPDKKTRELLQKHCVNNRKVVLFITHAAPEDAEDLQPMLEKFYDAAAGADIVDVFHCQGELSKMVKRIMSIMPNKQFREWAKNDCSQGQPDATRIASARAFSKDVIRRFKQNSGTASNKKAAVAV